jgi:DNA-binding NarL/FixJ family response regulator
MDCGFFRNENIKFVFVSDEEFFSNFNAKDFIDNCFIEVRVRKSFLNKLNLLSKSEHITDLHFTERELEVLHCLYLGLNNNQISEKLHISVHTTKAHIHKIYEKLSAQGRTEAVVKAIKENVITFK